MRTSPVVFTALAFTLGCSSESSDGGAGAATTLSTGAGGGGVGGVAPGGHGPGGAGLGGAGGGASGGADAGGGGAIPVGCENGHFGSGQSLALPSAFAPTELYWVFGSDTCTDGSFQWWLLYDFDGNGRDDFVVTADDCYESGASASAWVRYAVDETGFGAATTVSLPTLPVVLTSLDQIESCDVGGDMTFSQWHSADLTGDGALDLVGTADECFGSHELGTWLVYEGGPTGFAEPVSWTIPHVGESAVFPFSELSGAHVCTENTRNLGWTLADLDADAIPDLVIQRSCNDPDVGVGKWLVYRGTGAAFAATATAIALPPAPAPFAGWFLTNGVDVQGTGELEDINADGRLDLVSRTGVGDDYQVAFGRSDGSFDPTTSAFPNPIVVPSCGYGDQFNAERIDMDGDGRRDLVLVRDDCSDPAVGTSYWLVYRNDGTQFLPAIQWALPPRPGYGFAWKALSAVNACGLGPIAWATLDLTGDGIQDFLFTEDACGADTTLAADHWTLFPGVCD